MSSALWKDFAAEVTALIALPMDSPEEFTHWKREGAALLARWQGRIEVPKVIVHYIEDAAVRREDPEYGAWQRAQVKAVLRRDE